MESNLQGTIVTILLPLIGAGIGYLFKQGIEKKKELIGEVNKERREHYQQFVNLVIDIIGADKLGKASKNDNMLSKLYDFYKKYVLYASPEVINAFSDYFQFLYMSREEGERMDGKMHFKKLSRILIMMRKDLGLNNTGLGEDGERIFRALITDFDSIMLEKAT
jgi:hypothetical protein